VTHHRKDLAGEPEIKVVAKGTILEMLKKGGFSYGKAISM